MRVSKDRLSRLRYRLDLALGMASDDGKVGGADADSQIRVAERLEALGTLAGGLAHDLNNILTVIVTTSGMLRGKLTADDHAQQDLRTIEQAAARGSMLARRLLTFGRPEEGRKVAVDVSSVVGGSLELLQRLAGASVQIVPDLSFDGAEARADPVQLEQVLLNLVMNAVDAMPSGGTITIRVRGEPLAGEDARRRELADGDYVTLLVRDTGQGMDRAILDRVWEPFFTTKPDTGTGLGLSSVRRIVAEHHGAVEVTSGPGRGAVFCIWLPAVLSPEAGRRSSTGSA